MDCRQARELLEEYRRRELGADAAAAVESHLAQCAACRRVLDEIEAFAARVRALPRAPVPPRLGRAVRRLDRARGVRGWLGRPWVAAAVAAGLVALALAPWLRFTPDRPTDALDALIQSGVAEHRRIAVLAEGTRDVEDPAPLFREVERLTGIPLPPAFAGDAQMTLLQARPTVLANRKAAAVVLRDPASFITTYFALPGKDLPPPPEAGRVKIETYRPYMRQMEGFNLVYWKQGEYAYLMVSDRDDPGTRQLYLKMRKAM